MKEGADIQAEAEPIIAYLQQRGAHRWGTMWRAQLDALEEEYRSPGVSIETGCGASTILLSRLSRKHTAFCYDDRGRENSSVDFVRQAPMFEPARVEFGFGPTQLTLRTFEFREKLDFALLDGPHAFPFPELEYYFIYPHLKSGAILAVDDVHIPTLFNLYRFLREDDMFAFVRKVENIAIFRRTESPTFDPLGEAWEIQGYNRRRFPLLSMDERVARYVPKWINNLAPPAWRAAVKAMILRSRI